MTAVETVPPIPDILTAALAAWDAGLCVVTVADDGTKSPVGAWKQWQTQRPSREQVQRWFANGYPGIGVICGAVSGNLEMLEFEGRAVDDGTWDAFVDACNGQGLGHVLDRIIDGYAEKSPSNGNHLLYRCSTIQGNRKLARRSITEVLIETRGEGGFVVVAPSHGPTHPTGGAWELVTGSFATIATISPEERDELFFICEQFNTLDATTIAKPLPASVIADIDLGPIRAADGGSWIGKVCEELNRQPWADIFGRYGWELEHSAQGVDYWKRPGKEDAGWSATTNAKGTDRMIVFSSNTPFNEYTGRGKATSYDRLDVIATYSHGGDRVAAARSLTGSTVPTVTTFTARPGNVDPVTGEITQAPDADLTAALLPEEFWLARPMFEHIRTAARSRLIAPDALMGAILARVALMIDNRYMLPPIVGRYGTLDFLLGLAGKSGSGKGSTLDTSVELLPVRTGVAHDYRTTTMPVGSGEGMVHAYYERVIDKDEQGKRKAVWKRRYDGIMYRIDEGQALTALAARSGQTTMTTLRSAWSGEQLGGTYATDEKKVTLEPGSYRFVGVMAIQPALAKDMLADHIGGTPQRFVWLSMLDPHAPDETPEWPGELEWSPPVWTSEGAQPVNHGRRAQVIHVAASVQKAIRDERRLRLRGGGTEDDHSALRRLKVATILAALDEQLSVTDEHWAIAGYVADASERTIDAMRKAISDDEERGMQRDANTAGRRARAAELARASVADETDRAARQIAKHVHKHTGDTGEPCDQRCIRHSLRSTLRFAMPDGLSRSVALGWVDEDGETGFRAGDAKPA